MCQNFNVRGKVCEFPHAKLSSSFKDFPSPLGKSWSLLQSGFGKIIPYLSHAWAACLMKTWPWTYLRDQAYLPSHKANEWVTDEWWKPEQHHPLSERQLWRNQVCTCRNALSSRGCSARPVIGWWRREHRCVVYVWGKECYKSVHHRVQACHQMPSFSIMSGKHIW